MSIYDILSENQRTSTNGILVSLQSSYDFEETLIQNAQETELI